MPAGSAPTLTPDEARQLHEDAIVIDTQQPPITSGIVFTDGMRAAVQEQAAQGRTRAEAGPVVEAALVRDIQTSEAAGQLYLDMWDQAGVTAACGTYSGGHKFSTAFEGAVTKIANAQAIVSALNDDMLIARSAADVERAHTEANGRSSSTSRTQFHLETIWIVLRSSMVWDCAWSN